MVLGGPGRFVFRPEGANGGGKKIFPPGFDLSPGASVIPLGKKKKKKTGKHNNGFGKKFNFGVVFPPPEGPPFFPGGPNRASSLLGKALLNVWPGSHTRGGPRPSLVLFSP